MQEYWFCAQCKSMNRAGAPRCYKCRAPKAEATLATVVQRQEGVALTPGLDEEHRGLAWTLMLRQTYVSAWRLGYVAAGLLLAFLAVWIVLAGTALFAVLRSYSANSVGVTDSPFGSLQGPIGAVFGASVVVGALIAVTAVVIHSIFLCLTSMNAPALGSGAPRFGPDRAAIWWIESFLWAIRGGVAFVIPPFLALFAVGLGGAVVGLGLGVIWFMCAFWLLGDPVTCLGKPKRLLEDLWNRLGVPGSADSRIVVLWSAAWGTGRGLEYAVAGASYLFLIVFVIVDLFASMFGQGLDPAPESQVRLTATLLSVGILIVQFLADGIALFLLAKITLELARRQRVREEWVLGGLDMAKARAVAAAATDSPAFGATAPAGFAPPQPQPRAPTSPADQLHVVPAPPQPPSQPNQLRDQAPQAQRLAAPASQPGQRWPTLEEVLSGGTAPAPADAARRLMQPPSSTIPRYGSVSDVQSRTTRDGSSGPAGSDRKPAGDGPSGPGPDAPDYGAGI